METGIIKFHHTDLLTAKDESTGRVYVALKPIIEGIGLGYASQTQKLKSDNRYDIVTVEFLGRDGKNREMLSLATEHLAAYLYSINPNKVRADLKANIIAFQKETFNAINDYWNRGYAAREKGGETLGKTLELMTSQLNVLSKNQTNLVRMFERVLEKLQPDRVFDLQDKCIQLSQNSKPPRYNKRLSFEEKEQIETLYKEGYSPTEIGEQIGRSFTAVKQHLESRGIYKQNFTQIKITIGEEQ